MGRALEARIDVLGSTRVAVARTAGLDQSTLWKVRTGHGGEVSGRVLARVEAAVGWPHGTIVQIRDGADPPGVWTMEERLVWLEGQVAELRARLAELERGR